MREKRETKGIFQGEMMETGASHPKACPSTPRWKQEFPVTFGALGNLPLSRLDFRVRQVQIWRRWIRHEAIQKYSIRSGSDAI
jgi:hypothetical protein